VRHFSLAVSSPDHSSRLFTIDGLLPLLTTTRPHHDTGIDERLLEAEKALPRYVRRTRRRFQFEQLLGVSDAARCHIDRSHLPPV